MSRCFSCLAVMAAIFGMLAPASRGDDNVGSVPDDAKFAVRLDAQALQRSEVGKKLIELAKREALNQAPGDHDGEPALNLEKIKEIVGFDPFEEIQTVAAWAADYEHPEKSLTAVFRMRKTTGNIEGLLLSLPGYKVEDYGTHQIYSATPDDKSAFGAIHTSSAGDQTIIVSAKREAVQSMLDQFDGKSGTASTSKKSLGDTASDSIVAVKVFELPTSDLGEGPQANIAKTLHEVAIGIGESGGMLNLRVLLTAETDKQAEQLQQMAQGSIAMIGFARSADPDDEDLKQVEKIAQDVTFKRDGKTLEVRLGMPTADVVKLVEDQMNEK